MNKKQLYQQFRKHPWDVLEVQLSGHERLHDSLYEQLWKHKWTFHIRLNAQLARKIRIQLHEELTV